MTGVAREHFRKGDIAAALRAHAKAHQEHVISESLNDPLILSGMTRAWVEACLPLYPRALDDWESAVSMRIKNFSVEISHSIALACKKHSRDVARPRLVYSGKDGVVYIDHCPLCGAENVKLQNADSKNFHPPRWYSGLSPNYACNHRLPLDPLLWQAILNANILISEGVIEPG